MDIKSDFKSILKLDKRLSHKIRLENFPKPIRQTSKYFAHSGDAWPWWPVLILIWLLGNTFWKQWVLTVILGIAMLAVFMLPVKHLVNRRRLIRL